MIEKLKDNIYHGTNGDIGSKPTTEQIMDKINEIIDVINERLLDEEVSEQ